MCGLVGMAGDLGFKHRSVMKTLLFFNTLRGKDSTGLTAFNQRANEVETRKLTVPGFEFIQMPWIDNLLSSMCGVWLGHGRAKTVGDVTRVNAHPFSVTNEDGSVSMFGAHNGTLTNKFDVEKELDGERFGTDSEALINLIGKVGVKNAIAKASGAWALTFWNADDNSVNFIRNKERPLVYAFTDDRKVLMWASEAWMLRVACQREGVAFEQNDKGEDLIWGTLEDTHYKFKMPSFMHNGKPEDKVFASPVKKGGLLGKIVPEKKNFYNGASYNRQAWKGHGWWDDDADDGLEQKTTSSSTEKGKDGTTSKSEKGPNQLIGFEGQLVDRSFVDELKKQGCDWCGDVIEPKADDFAWLDDMSVCCNRCLRGEHVVIAVQEGTILKRVLSVIGGNKK